MTNGLVLLAGWLQWLAMLGLLLWFVPRER